MLLVLSRGRIDSPCAILGRCRRLGRSRRRKTVVRCSLSKAECLRPSGGYDIECLLGARSQTAERLIDGNESAAGGLCRIRLQARQCSDEDGPGPNAELDAAYLLRYRSTSSRH